MLLVFSLHQFYHNTMVTTFFSIPHDDLKLAASIRPAASVAMEAQKEAIIAQKVATEAQHEALTAQAAELGIEPPPSDIALLRATAELVKAVDQKIVDRACL